MYANIWLYSLLNAARGCMILFWPAHGTLEALQVECVLHVWEDLRGLPLSVDDFMGFHGVSWHFLWGFTNGWIIVERSIRDVCDIHNGYQKVLENWIVNLIPFPDVKPSLQVDTIPR